MLRLKKTINLLTRGSRSIVRAPIFAFGKELKSSEKHLIQSLNTELNYEDETQEKEVGDFEEKFMASHNWELIASDSSTKMELKKQIGRTTVRVIYSAKLPEDQDMQEEQQQGEEQNTDQNIIDFLVVVDNHNNPNKLIVDMAAFNGELNVNAVLFSSDVESLLSNKAALFNTEKYVGPSFDSLDEKLQDSFYDYLKNLGIDEDLATFIESSSVNQEEVLYKKWLKDFRDFLHN